MSKVKNVKKLQEILVGWRNLVFKSSEIEEMATKRIEICVDCTIPDADGREINGLNESNRCVKCKCYMPAKTRNPKSACPLNKW